MTFCASACAQISPFHKDTRGLDLNTGSLRKHNWTHKKILNFLPALSPHIKAMNESCWLHLPIISPSLPLPSSQPCHFLLTAPWCPPTPDPSSILYTQTERSFSKVLVIAFKALQGYPLTQSLKPEYLTTVFKAFRRRGPFTQTSCQTPPHPRRLTHLQAPKGAKTSLVPRSLNTPFPRPRALLISSMPPSALSLGSAHIKAVWSVIFLYSHDILPSLIMKYWGRLFGPLC